MLLILSLPIGSLASPAASPVLCRTSKEQRWICKGSQAWVNAFLIEQPLMRKLRQKAELAALVPELQRQRKELQEQRDAEQASRKGWQGNAGRCAAARSIDAGRAAELRKQLHDAPSGRTVLLAALLGGAAGIVLSVVLVVAL